LVAAWNLRGVFLIIVLGGNLRFGGILLLIMGLEGISHLCRILCLVFTFDVRK
jgi:hypothetical protein